MHEDNILAFIGIRRCIHCDRRTSQLNEHGLCVDCTNDRDNMDIDIDEEFVA